VDFIHGLFFVFNSAGLQFELIDWSLSIDSLFVFLFYFSILNYSIKKYSIMIIHLLYLISGFFGLLTLVIILNNYRFNRMMNLYILLIFLLVSVRFLFNGFIYFGFMSFLKPFYLNFNKFLIVIIPCLYLYFKNLIVDKKSFFIKKDLLHFIFPILFICTNIYILSTKNFYFNTFHAVFYFGLFLFNATYCLLAYHILNRNIWKRNKAVGTKTKDEVLLYNWTLFLFILQVVNTIRLLTALYLEHSESPINILGDRFQWITALIWTAIFIKILVSPEILYGYSVLNTKVRAYKFNDTNMDSPWNMESNSSLITIQELKLKEKVELNLEKYIKEIELLSLEFGMFKDPKFLVSDLVKKLRIPKSHISYLFKYHSKISFFDFKNKMRIQESIRLMESGYLKTNTLDSLAKEIGFASYNPFLLHFKKTVGISPQKYVKQL